MAGFQLSSPAAEVSKNLYGKIRILSMGSPSEQYDIFKLLFALGKMAARHTNLK
jgi:hypothetical protein